MDNQLDYQARSTTTLEGAYPPSEQTNCIHITSDKNYNVQIPGQGLLQAGEAIQHARAVDLLACRFLDRRGILVSLALKDI